MKYNKHIAPEGYVYVKDGEASRVVITLSNSDIIDSYDLVLEEEFIKEKGDDK